MVDYIIVGAGSAGCVLANRLTEDPHVHVLLLEAGGPDHKPDIRIPARWSTLLGTEVDWLYRTEPQVHLNNRVIDWNRGKVLGGSSSINNMVYIRGDRWDYDHWAELGNEEWSYDEILPYFKKAENQERGASEYHGVGGPLNVADMPYVALISDSADAFIEAGIELGWPLNHDFNGATQEGIGRYQFTRRGGQRHSAADAYLKPALSRPNLTTVTYAQVTRLLFTGTHVSGVEYVHDHQLKQTAATREVILCGGAINSPQILLLSGIGPAGQLTHFGIPVVVDLPGVGENLQDHALLEIDYARVERAIAENILGGAAHQEYLQSQTGPLAVNRTAGGAFVKTRADLERPDMQLYIAPGDDAASEADFGIYLSIMRPKDRGTITLRSRNPFEHPVIQPNYLACEDDLQTFIDGVKVVRQLAATSALAPILVREIAPGSAVQTDAELAAWIRQALRTTWHYSGTCKMGIDPLAVVNPRLQVYGVTGLRVVDASIMPEVIGGNTNAPVIMIAEKAADLIREEL